MQLKKLKISDIKPAEYNPRAITEEELEGLKESIKKFGQKENLIVNKDMTLISGHQRLKAMQELGHEEAYFIVEDLSKEDEKALNLTMNNQAISGDYNMDKLQPLLLELKDYEEFDLLRLGELQMEIEELEPEVVEDEAPEPPKEPITIEGDLYELITEETTHRVLCGDSTDVKAVEKLMNGEKADMVFTDPPYNTGMTEKTNSGSTRLNHMFEDSFTDEEWEDFMSMFVSNYFIFLKEDTVAYICLDWRRNHELIPHIKNHFKLSNIIIWDKVVHGLGSDYKYTYELINVCKKGKPKMNTHQGDREYSDVWHIQRKMGKDEEHATKKPIELCIRPMKHASKKGDLVLDLFLGSGSTLLAAHQLKRNCYGQELDPKYCDVIVKRYINLMKDKEFTIKRNGEEIDPTLFN